MLAAQLRAARALLGWSQIDLAESCGLSVATIKRMEKSSGSLVGRHQNVMSIGQTFEAEGVVFIEAEGQFGPGVRLRFRHPDQV